MQGFEDLKGKILVSAEIKKENEDRLIFKTVDGWEVTLQHYQDCCENVYIEDVAGDLNDLVGEPILMAEESSSDDPDAGECGMWTFYKLATVKGYVTLRWYGASNGYYSVSVSTECKRINLSESLV